MPKIHTIEVTEQERAIIWNLMRQEMKRLGYGKEHIWGRYQYKPNMYLWPLRLKKVAKICGKFSPYINEEVKDD